MNQSTNKPLTYNRFRAYLRIKLKNQSFSKTRLLRILFILLFYILCSLTLFLLPYNILTQYPYLKHFTDFMDFIPAIKQMEFKTFAPELCKFYASYMFVIGIGCWGYLLREFIMIMLVFCVRHNKDKKKIIRKFLLELKTYTLCFIGMDILSIWYIYKFLSGYTIGHSKYRSSDEYFIYTLGEMLYYGLIEIGFIFVVGMIFIVVGNIFYFDTFKHNWSKIQWLTKKKI